MQTYPISLTGLDRVRCVVVGGGRVALRKVNGLLEAGAQVTVVSPDVGPDLEALAVAGRIEARRRAYAAGDLAGAALAIAATDDQAVNQAVWREAVERGCLVNVVDDPEHCNFILPAVLRRGPLTVSISTGGASPALARYLREFLDDLISPDFGDFATLLADMRTILRARLPDAGERAALVETLIDDPQLAKIMKRRGMAAARAYVLGLLDRPPRA